MSAPLALTASRNPALLSLSACLLLAPTAAPGQPLGSELRVNTVTSGAQHSRSHALDAQGRLVVVWTDTSNVGGGNFGQRFAANGAPRGGAFRVNTNTTGYQNSPRVAAAPGGAFAVVWTARDEAGDIGDLVVGQRFAESGAPLGGAFRVNTYTTSNQRDSAVTADTAETFAVVWSGIGQGGYGILLQRFAGTGEPIGTELRVNSDGNGDRPSIASAAEDRFVVVWRTISGTDILGRRFLSGAPSGAEFRVNTTPVVDRPSAALGPGGFVVVWQASDGDGSGIFGQRFGADGAPSGSEFQVPASTTTDQTAPRVAMENGGRFVVVWQSDPGDGSSRAVWARRFEPSGSPIGGELRVNTFTTGGQHDPFVAASPAGLFAVVWSSDGQDGSDNGVYAQLFRGCTPGDANGDLAVNVVDVLYLINHLFAGGPPPTICANANGDASVNVTDVLYLINHLFAGGPAPV